MRFKRTKFIAGLEQTIGTEPYKTGRYVYFREQPGAALARMTLKNYAEYIKLGGYGNRQKFFWSNADFVEDRDNALS